MRDAPHPDSVSISNDGTIGYTPLAFTMIPGLMADALNLTMNDQGEAVFRRGGGDETSIYFWDGTFHEVLTGFQLSEPRMNNHREIVFSAPDEFGTNTVFLATPVPCGDGVQEDPEECDDGNTHPGDGCRADCTAEICGDGIEDPHQEECDDGNTVDRDGCSPECLSGPVCGNGAVQPPEQCDDGNTVDGDGCSGDCTVPEPGQLLLLLTGALVLTAQSRRARRVSPK